MVVVGWWGGGGVWGKIEGRSDCWRLDFLPNDLREEEEEEEEGEEEGLLPL